MSKKYYDTLDDLLQEYPKRDIGKIKIDWSKENPINNLKFLCRIDYNDKEAYWAAQCLCCKKYSYYRNSHIVKKNIQCCAHENIGVDKYINNFKILYLKERSPRKIWTCQCLCENKTIKDIREDCLLDGSTKSCGCYNKKNNLYTSKDYSSQETKKYIIKEKTEFKASNGAYLWTIECKKCHNIYNALPTEILRDKWNPCTNCWGTKSKGADIIRNLLLNNNINFIEEYVLFNYSYSNRPCKIDFFIDNSYVIEYDGLQHFEIGWSITQEDFKHRREIDIEKNHYCFNNNIPIIRIPYTCKEITLDMILLNTSKYILTENNELNYFSNRGYKND